MLYSNYIREKSHNTVKVKEVEGVPPLILTKSKGKNAKDYQIYGNSTQDGTPTPDSPVEIQSVGDLVTDTASEHYGKYDVPILVRGKNLFGTYTVTGVNLKRDESSTSEVYIATGNEGLSAGAYSAGQVNVQMNNYCPANTVTISFYVTLLETGIYNNNTQFFLGTASEYSKYTSGVYSLKPNARTRISWTLTPTVECNRISIRLNNNKLKLELNTLQIEYGTQSTSYEPYVEPITTNIYLNEPLRKIGDCADYIDYKNKKVVRNIYKRVFVGTENWKDTNVGRFYLMISAISGLPSNKIWCLCNRLIAQTWDTIWNNYKLQDGSYVVGIARKSDALQVTPYQTKPTLDEWKAQLATWNEEGNPFTVWYVDSPREETIELPNIPTLKGSNSLIIDSTISPSSIKVKYLKL